MTIKQDWHREREFIVKGHLLSISKQLDRILKKKSILPSERIELRIAIKEIQKILSAYDLPSSKILSFENYKWSKS